MADKVGQTRTRNLALLLVLLGTGGLLFGVQQIRNAGHAAEQRAAADVERNSAVEVASTAERERDRAIAELDVLQARVKQAEAAAREKEEDRRMESGAAEELAYVSDMLLVQHAWNENRIDRCKELLDRYRDRDDLRRFEWHYWDRLAQSDLLTIEDHAGGVLSVSFSPDGTRLATADASQSISIWNTVTGAKSHTLPGHKGIVHDVYQVSFSPDGKYLASAGGDGTVRVCNADTGQEVHTLEDTPVHLACVAFSPDGMRLASAAADTTVKLWDARPWTPESRAERSARALLLAHRAGVNSLEELQEAVSSDRTVGNRARKLASEWAELFWRP
jgi:hypothetical protein